MAESKNNIALAAFLKQAQTLVTLAYLTMVSVGMLYYHQKYSEFEINIFQYADILYFLIAPFEDTFIFLLCLVAVILFWVIYKTDGFFREKAPRFYTFFSLGLNKTRWSEQIQAASWPIFFISLLLLYSQIYGDRAKKAVLESKPIAITFSDNQKVTGQLIGKTDRTLFLLDGTEVKAIPLESGVKEIIITSSFSAAAE